MPDKQNLFSFNIEQNKGASAQENERMLSSLDEELEKDSEESEVLYLMSNNDLLSYTQNKTFNLSQSAVLQLQLPSIFKVPIV